jgi:acyl carrier protein
MTLEEARPIILERLSGFLGRQLTYADLACGYDELGADSMDMVALAFELETLAERPFYPELFLQHDTIQAALVSFFADA